MAVVSDVVRAVAYISESFGLDIDKEFFDMEHDILFIPGPSKKYMSDEQISHLESLGVYWSDEYDSLIS